MTGTAGQLSSIRQTAQRRADSGVGSTMATHDGEGVVRILVVLERTENRLITHRKGNQNPRARRPALFSYLPWRPVHFSARSAPTLIMGFSITWYSTIGIPMSIPVNTRILHHSGNEPSGSHTNQMQN